jgi:hypothetical protein
MLEQSPGALGGLERRLPVPLGVAFQPPARITIGLQPSWKERTAGILQWTGDFEDFRRIVDDDDFGIREGR